MTESWGADAGEYDELAAAAAREHAGRLVARRRLRAWLMSASASAVLIALALNVVSLMDGQPHRSRSPELILSAPPDLSVLNIDSPEQLPPLLRGVVVLALIALPAGWSSSVVTSTDVVAGTGRIHWSTVWTAGNQATDGPRDIAAALTSQGWQRCAGGGARSECWQLGTSQLILTWGPGEGCPSQGPCWQARVVLSTSATPTSPVALAPGSDVGPGNSHIDQD